MIYIINFDISDKLCKYLTHDDDDDDDFNYMLFKLVVKSPSWKVKFDDDSFIDMSSHNISIEGLEVDEFLSEICVYGQFLLKDPKLPEDAVRLPDKNLPVSLYKRVEKTTTTTTVEYVLQ